MVQETPPQVLEDADPDLLKLLEYLQTHRGFSFADYKATGLQRRLRKRMGQVGAAAYSDYLDYLEVHPDEFPHLFDSLLINVTSFFRDAQVWDLLRTVLVPDLVAGLDEGEPLRVWSVGCASGEEAYSLAMVLAEVLGEDDFRLRVKIYATDVDEDALTTARQGTYSLKEVQSIPQQLRERYFRQQDGRYTFRNDLRRNLIFGRHDAAGDAPISRVMLVSCRNTLMYFNSEAQEQIIRRLHFALGEGGLLVLGKAETLLTRSRLFAPVDLGRRIFRRHAGLRLRGQLLSLTHNRSTPSAEQHGDQELINAAFELNPVAELVVDANGALVQFNRRAAALFGLVPVDTGKPFQDLELSYRPVELRSPIDRAVAERQAVRMREVAWHRDEQTRWLDVTVGPLLDHDGELLGVSITFRDVSEAKQLQQELERTNRELDVAYEELQSTNEELETTNEELQSTIEEQETTNEELQSTNEELETMNEELQSTNEELSSINDELRRRTDELDQVNAYMESILVSLDAAMVVVDTSLIVQIWNGTAEELWGVRSDEAVGTHFLNLDIGFPLAELSDALRACLHGEEESFVSRFEGINRRGRTVPIVVRISPLRLASGATRGAIVVMEERPVPPALDALG